MEDINNNFINVPFFGFGVNDRFILAHGVEHMKIFTSVYLFIFECA
jgi:hypothetical protein